VLDHDATAKLQTWFETRWQDRLCLDISAELCEVIEESWAREKIIPPYYIYLKMAYHLSREARAGLAEYGLPVEFQDCLLDFQAIAVKVAARYVNQRGGVLIGDVVGLGKTLIGTALARILQDNYLFGILIICPKNLVSMWQDYIVRYGVRFARVMPLSRVITELSHLERYHVVLIDESHNLRNRESKRYRAIRDYIERNESKCILLSATPYNKSYLDLSSQLRLFIPEDKNIGILPNRLIREIGGEAEFRRRYPVDIHSLRAFELSDRPDDWRELMKLFTLRRTRSFIKSNYTKEDEFGRKYLRFTDGSRSYFPTRLVRNILFEIGTPDRDPYAALYSDEVVDVINSLYLPRYGLGNYEIDRPHLQPDANEQRILDNLSHAGRRLMGFCRTNLFKRLESSGFAFIQSLDRHILRNYIYLHAIENGLEIPIGSQDAGFLDTRQNDRDRDSLASIELEGDDTEDTGEEVEESVSVQDYRQRAREVYLLYATRYRKRFQWIRSDLFTSQLAEDLLADASALRGVWGLSPQWDADKDRKLAALQELLGKDDRKVLIFTQFADTATYLQTEICERISDCAIVTGSTENPTELVYRFSPKSNQQNICRNEQLRVLIATDVLSEGQNLQDCAIVVNYDLPWAIIRLIQRAGRVDRIGQEAENIYCYSFLPAEGVERLINLRGRLRQRLDENAEVVGTDEEFFEGEGRVVRDLYHEKEGTLDDPEDNEVDLTSEAFQIWKNALDRDPDLQEKIENLADVSYSCRVHEAEEDRPEGALVYLRTAEGNDSLAYIDRQGNSVTRSQLEILRPAACEPDTPAIPRNPVHHQLVEIGAIAIADEEASTGGQLGRPSSVKSRCYHRLQSYINREREKRPLFVPEELEATIQEMFQYPLRQSAIDILGRQLKNGISDEGLAELVMALRADDRLRIVSDGDAKQEPQIICSMGLYQIQERL
jgi:superfamily II DNA or RNA helicase